MIPYLWSGRGWNYATNPMAHPLKESEEKALVEHKDEGVQDEEDEQPRRAEPPQPDAGELSGDVQPDLQNVVDIFPRNQRRHAFAQSLRGDEPSPEATVELLDEGDEETESADESLNARTRSASGQFKSNKFSPRPLSPPQVG